MTEPTPLPVEPEPEAPTPTILDNFVASAELLKETKRRTQLNEGTLVKLFELNLLWAVNQNQPTFVPPITPADEVIND